MADWKCHCSGGQTFCSYGSISSLHQKLIQNSTQFVFVTLNEIPLKLNKIGAVWEIFVTFAV